MIPLNIEKRNKDLNLDNRIASLENPSKVFQSVASPASTVDSGGKKQLDELVVPENGTYILEFHTIVTNGGTGHILVNMPINHGGALVTAIPTVASGSQVHYTCHYIRSYGKGTTLQPTITNNTGKSCSIHFNLDVVKVAPYQ